MKLKDNKTASTLLASLLCLLQHNFHREVRVHKEVDLFRKADRYIRRNLQTATVESTARYLHVSERTLLSVFQNLLGIKTIEYIQEIKADMARHLLSQDCTVKELAERLGYADQFSFHKSFKKKYGISPSQYKKAYNSGKRT